MRWRLLGSLAVLLLLVWARESYGVFLHQSAILGETGDDSGYNIGGSQLASRFTLTQRAQVTYVGGHVGNFLGEALFAAIIPLPSADGLPTFRPFEIESFAFGSALFTPDRLSSEVRVPLSTNLASGHYALVFGSRFFGSPISSQGFMPCIDPCDHTDPATHTDMDLPGASYFYGGNTSPSSAYIDSGIAGTRFFVEGMHIPEPSTIALFAAGLLGIGLVVKQGRRN